MSRIFMTGGAGFIGTCTAKKLLKLGHEIALYDSFVNYIFPLNKSHIDNVQNRMNMLGDDVRHYRGRTQDQDLLRRAIFDYNPDRIIHLAAMPLANISVEHPEECVRAIIMGTQNLLQIARDLPDLKRLVYISSSMVYGDFARIPVREDDPKDPKEVYGSIKLSGELLTRAFGRLFDINYTIVRPSAVYGPTDNNRRVLNIFLENALKGKPLTVKGADRVLDFTFVEDLADGITLACLHDDAAGGTFNITRGRGRSLREAAEIVASLVPGTDLIIEEAEKYLPKRGALDITAARRVLGYDPKVDIEEGLANYLEYLKVQQ